MPLLGSFVNWYLLVYLTMSKTTVNKVLIIIIIIIILSSTKTATSAVETEAELKALLERCFFSVEVFIVVL